MISNAYPFLVTELDLPERIEYEFRTFDDVLYACFFTLNPIYLDESNLLNAYEIGLTDVLEKNETRKTDYKIKQTVSLIFLDFLSRQKTDFLVSIHYSNSDRRAEKRLVVFNKWFEDLQHLSPFEKYNKVVEIDEHLFYESIIIHSNHIHKNKIVTEFFK
jgi:hypothetical protein